MYPRRLIQCAGASVIGACLLLSGVEAAGAATSEHFAVDVSTPDLELDAVLSFHADPYDDGGIYGYYPYDGTWDGDPASGGGGYVEGVLEGRLKFNPGPFSVGCGRVLVEWQTAKGEVLESNARSACKVTRNHVSAVNDFTDDPMFRQGAHCAKVAVQRSTSTRPTASDWTTVSTVRHCTSLS